MISVKINLLPWRAQERTARMQRFTNHLAVAIFAGVAAAAGLGYYIDGQIDKQNDRIMALNSQISSLSSVQKQLDDSKNNVELLSTRIRSMNTLSSRRNDIVKLFSELSLAIPNEIFLSKLDITDLGINIIAMSENDSAIIQFTENLKKSDGMTNPVMNERSDTKVGDTNLRRFNMTITRSAMKP